MSIKSKIGLLLSIVFLAVSTWYLFIKEYDYQYTFRVAALKGVIFQKITDWTTSKVPGIDSTEIQNRMAFTNIYQTIWIDNQHYNVHWDLSTINDTITQVDIGVNTIGDGTKTRFKMLLGENLIKTHTLALFLDFRTYLDNFLKSNSVSDNIQIEKTPEHWSAFVTIESDIKSKSTGMMANNAYINAFLAEHELNLAGKPYLEVLHWDLNQQRIKFNFCFPIHYCSDLPDHETIKFKKTKSAEALKTIYQGNYRYTDRAWYTLLDYARKNNVTISPKPLEVYLNNPVTDGNEYSWKAEIYLPILNEIP